MIVGFIEPDGTQFQSTTADLSGAMTRKNSANGLIHSRQADLNVGFIWVGWFAADNVRRVAPRRKPARGYRGEPASSRNSWRARRPSGAAWGLAAMRITW